MKRMFEMNKKINETYGHSNQTEFDKEDIECSPNHRFYSKNKAKWIKAKDLTKEIELYL